MIHLQCQPKMWNKKQRPWITIDIYADTGRGLIMATEVKGDFEKYNESFRFRIVRVEEVE